MKYNTKIKTSANSTLHQVGIHTELKPIIFTTFFILCSFLTNGQTDFKSLELKLASLVDSTWAFNIDTTKATQGKLNGLSLLKSGQYFGTLNFSKKETQKVFLEMIIFKNTNDSIIQEIDYYHILASCKLFDDINRIHDKKIKLGQFLLFFPMYPCWTKKTTEIAYKILERINETTK